MPMHSVRTLRVHVNADLDLAKRAGHRLSLNGVPRAPRARRPCLRAIHKGQNAHGGAVLVRYFHSTGFSEMTLYHYIKRQ